MSDTTITETVVVTGRDGERLLVRPRLAPSGQMLASIAPQYRGADGAWRLRHSGLLLTPATMRALVPALLALADYVDATAAGGE